MKTVRGTGNWILTVREKDAELEILRALTCDADAELPGEISGLPVTSLCDSAMAVKNYEPDGDRITVTCGKSTGDMDNAALESLSLPDGLKSAGKYAFAGCRKLKTLSMYDSFERIGAGAFMNCMSLSDITVKRQGELQGIAVCSLVSELSRELRVRILGPSGDEARLVFPEYFEVREENEPTHFFSYMIEGAGYPYHNIFRKRQLSIPEYDGLWKRFIASDYEVPTAVELAWSRLRYPVQLSPEAGADYREYLSARLPSLYDYILGKRDVEGFALALKMCDPGREALEYARAKANSLGLTEAVVLVLEKQHELFPKKINRYEL